MRNVILELSQNLLQRNCLRVLYLTTTVIKFSHLEVTKGYCAFIIHMHYEIHFIMLLFSY